MTWKWIRSSLFSFSCVASRLPCVNSSFNQSDAYKSASQLDRCTASSVCESLEYMRSRQFSVDGSIPLTRSSWRFCGIQRISVKFWQVASSWKGSHLDDRSTDLVAKRAACVAAQSEPEGSVRGERANFTGLVLGCIEATFCN